MTGSHLIKGWLISVVLGLVTATCLLEHVIDPVYAWITGAWLTLLLCLPLSLIAASRVAAVEDRLEHRLLGLPLRRRRAVDLVRLKWGGFILGLRLHFSDGSVMRFPLVSRSTAHRLGRELSRSRRRHDASQQQKTPPTK